MTDTFTWFAVFLAIGLPALLLTRWLRIKLDRRRRAGLVEAITDGINPSETKLKLRERLATAGHFGWLLPIWPLAVSALLSDFVMKRIAGHDDETDLRETFKAKGFLTQKVTVRQAETIETIPDHRKERPARPFGYLAEAWILFLSRQQTGSELWAFERPQGIKKGFDHRYSRGYCWVNAGRIIAEIAVEGSPGTPLTKNGYMTHLPYG